MDGFSPDGLSWRAVLDACPLPVSLVSLDGRQLYGNPAYAEFLGYDVSEFAALDVSRVTLPEDQAWTTNYQRRLITGDLAQYSSVKRYVRKDGAQVAGLLTAQAVREGDEVRALIATITPMNLPEPMAAPRLRKLIENVSDTISLVDENGRILETAGRYTPVMGYPSEFWEERTLFDLVPEEDLPQLAELQEKVFAGPGDLITGEIRLRNSEGGLETVAVSAVNLLHDEDIRGIVLTTRNITTFRRLIEELSRSRDEALAEAELRSRLVATVSHELRNPMHAVLGLSELLSRGEVDSAADLAGLLHRQVGDLVRILDDLLTSSRLEAGALTLMPEPVDVRAVVADLVSVLAATAADGVEVAACVADDLSAEVITDPVRLRQLIANLLGNAIKFTPAGRVTVEVATDRAVLRVVVRDTGVGIPADAVDRLFEPFEVGDSPGTGAGLGLSIVRRIVELLGGELSFESEVGVGTVVSLKLPVGEVAPAAAVPPPSGPLDGGLHVLVVEDNPVNQQLAAAQLELLGHRCIIAGTGEVGLALLTEPGAAPFDVVLMDFHLPGLDGLEVTGALRQWERDHGRPRTRVVAVTASAALGDRTASLAADMDDHLSKPVRLADLERVLRREAAADPMDVTGTPALVAGAAAESLDGTVLDGTVLDGLVEELGDRAVVEGMVQTYLDELERRTEGIIAAVAAGEEHRRSLLVHTLSSSSRLVGATALAEAARQFPGEVDEAGLRSTAAGVGAALRRWLSP